MAGFTNDEDLRRYLGGIFEAAFAHPSLGPKLKETGIVLRMCTTSPDGELTVDFVNEKVGLGDLGVTPDATLTMTSEDANLFWQGKVNLPMALARKRIVVDGKMGALLKLAPQTKDLFDTYVGLLQRDNRTDLLAS